MERNVGQANGMARQESRSIIGASVVRNYFQADADPGGAVSQTLSLAMSQLATMPPGTLPPVVLPFDPTSSTPIAMVALNSQTQGESTLFDVGRYEVRSMIMSNPGAVAPVVFGGKVRAVMLYLDRQKLQARGLSPVDVMNTMDNFNLFLPAGDAKFGNTDFAIDSNSMYDLVSQDGRHAVADPVRQPGVRQGRGHPQGRRLHPDQCRPDRRRQGPEPSPGLHPDLPTARLEHTDGHRHPQGRNSRG